MQQTAHARQTNARPEGAGPGDPAAIRVLLVEDEPTQALLVRDMLEEMGPPRFEVTHLSRVRAALETLKAQRFDVLLLDLSLPDAVGLDGVQQLALAAGEAPIIVLTGLDNDATAVRAMRGGAQDYLVKGQVGGPLLAKSIRYAIERKRADALTAWLAHFDPLTGLANRSTFRDTLAHAMARARRDATCVALLFIDLDRFKAVNDGLGHKAGDRLLQETASRIKATVRDSDTVCRIGGDEFTLILEALEQPAAAAGVAAKIIDALSEPFRLGEASAVVTPSIGVAVYTGAGEDAEALICNADAAMYRAKATGGNSYQFHRNRPAGALRRRHSMEHDLTRALERETLEIHYQPKVEVRTGRILGAEALVRWRNGDGGLVLPAEFIPLAEECGLICLIGEYVLRRACVQSAAWQNGVSRPVPVAVNVSAKQLRRGDFVDVVASAIADSGIAPQCLEIELTESVLVADLGACSAAFERLKSMGVVVGLDDFGTGYSSLSYLKRLPLDLLKIDRSFVHGLLNGGDDAAIVDAIIALGHSLRMAVVAEGVETLHQRDYLDARGCEFAQGFLYSQAVDADAFVAMLGRGHTADAGDLRSGPVPVPPLWPSAAMDAG